MAFTANGRMALPAAGHSAGTLPVKNQGLVKFCNGELMGKKLYSSKFQQRISNNNVRRSHSCMAVATSIAGEAKVSSFLGLFFVLVTSVWMFSFMTAFVTFSFYSISYPFGIGEIL